MGGSVLILFVTLVWTVGSPLAAADSSIVPATDLLPPEGKVSETQDLPVESLSGELEPTEKYQTNSLVNSNFSLHDQINEHLGADEERVLAGGEVKVRKKRTFCKRCYPTQSYGYGGGGGCCGQCGQCGGGYIRPIKVVKVVKIKPFLSYGYGGYGGGCSSCYNPCSVCGR